MFPLNGFHEESAGHCLEANMSREAFGTGLPSKRIKKGDITLSKETVEHLSNQGYQIKRKLGTGSYGCVVLAYSKTHQQNVAIKIMEIARLGQDFINRFLSREIEMLKSIRRHPNLVQFHEINRDEEYFYIVLEYCPNGDLYEYICKHRFIPEFQCCFWFKQLIEGINHCHQSGFAHRDLKCENILLDENFNIKIGDFGFACKLKRKPNEETPQKENMSSNSLEVLSRTFCGSMLYASPEVLKGQAYNPIKSDIWSCGVILWIMVYGCYPFEEEHIREALETHDFHFKFPDIPDTSPEFKAFMENIFTEEAQRFSVEQMKQSDWYKKEWSESEKVQRNKEFYENLCIPRQETTEMILTTTRTNTRESSEEGLSHKVSELQPRIKIKEQFKLQPEPKGTQTEPKETQTEPKETQTEPNTTNEASESKDQEAESSDPSKKP